MVAQKPKNKTFSVDCSGPVEDGIFDLSKYTHFIQSSFKVNGGKAGELGESVTVRGDGSKLVVSAKPGTRFPKRYLKYLTKRYLKKDGSRDLFRIIAAKKNAYVLKLAIAGGDEAGEEQAE